MAISQGEILPNASLYRFGQDGPELVNLHDLLKGRNVVLFAVPGAFTPTCSLEHIPSFIKHADALREQKVDEIICISVNDPFVLKNWDEQTGASKSGISLLGDANAQFTKAIGMEFTAPPVGLYDRSARYSMYVVDGIVKYLNKEDSPGVCDITSGEELLKQISR